MWDGENATSVVMGRNEIEWYINEQKEIQEGKVTHIIIMDKVNTMQDKMSNMTEEQMKDITEDKKNDMNEDQANNITQDHMEVTKDQITEAR